MASIGGKKKTSGLITPPGARLLKNITLKFASKGNLTGKRSGYAELNLTSMVDMMTILVIFLIQFFSTTGELTPPSPNTKLPNSPNYQKFALDVPSIGINSDGIYFRSYKYLSTEDSIALAKEKTPKWLIPNLNNDLCAGRAIEKELHKNPEGSILLYVDENTPYAAVKLAMFNANKCGYINVGYATKKPS